MPRRDLRIDIELPIEGRALAGSLTELERRQLPFAFAATLTKVARVAAASHRKHVRRKFDIRSERVPKGIRYERAEKRDWPRITATVGTVDRFMARHEAGGVQKPRGQHFAIPSRLALQRRTSSGRIRKSARPRQLLQAGKAGVTSDGRRIARRLTGRERVNRGLATWYLLRPRIRLKPQLNMERSVHATARAMLPKVFEVQFAAAVKSARAKPGRFTSSEGKAFYWKALRKVTRGGPRTSRA